MTTRKNKKSKGRKPVSGIAALAAAQAAADDALDDLDAYLASKPAPADAPADVSAFVPDGTPPPDARALATAVVRAALDAALPARLRARLAAGKPLAVIVAVPDRSWISEVEADLRRMAPGVRVVARDGSSRTQHKPDYGQDTVAYALADGRPVIGVAASPETVLPAALMSSSDARVDVAALSGTALRKLLRRFARGPVPRDLPQAPCASLSFYEIVSAFRGGATAREVLANFARSRARKAGGGRADDVPPLTDLPGFSGEARVWGEKLVDGFARWRAGACEWRDLDASAVLAGPPGAGKTYFARSLARALDAPFHVTAVGDWFARSDGALGGVTQRFMSVWDDAMSDARAGGAIILFDEVDAIPDRAQLTDRGREWWTSLISQILTVFDGAATDRTGLALLGATNAGSSAAPASTLDAALLRNGRFGRVIWCPLPSADDLASVVSYHLAGALSAASLVPAVSLATDASAADAAAWARDARNVAAAAGRPVEVGDVVAAIAPPDARSDDDRRRAAVHEGGHAVAAVHLGWRLDGVSIVQQGRSGGRTSHALPALPTASDIDRAAAVALAGRAAEEVLLGAPSAGAEGDLASATALVAGAHASAGLGATA